MVKYEDRGIVSRSTITKQNVKYFRTECVQISSPHLWLRPYVVRTFGVNTYMSVVAVFVSASPITRRSTNSFVDARTSYCKSLMLIVSLHILSYYFTCCCYYVQLIILCVFILLIVFLFFCLKSISKLCSHIFLICEGKSLEP
jgi:hypothetical protein